MKNILQIIESLGIELSDEQKQNLEKSVNENYKTVADYNKQVKKTEQAETAKNDLQTQLNDAQETIKKFDEVDIEGYKTQIEEYKNRAEQAEKDAETKLTQRDQRDWLKEKLGAAGYDIKNERIRRSLISDIMDTENGLKWRNGAFLGFDDFMKQEKEADPSLYLTEEEKKEKEKADKAKETAPRFTEPSDSEAGDKNNIKPVPKIW